MKIKISIRKEFKSESMAQVISELEDLIEIVDTQTVKVKRIRNTMRELLGEMQEVDAVVKPIYKFKLNALKKELTNIATGLIFRT